MAPGGWIDLSERQFTAGAGCDGRLLSPGDDLPPPPWSAMPRLTYAQPEAQRHRLLCGFLQARVLAMSPMRYLREWRLYLASAELADSGLPLQRVAEHAGYGTEAAFNRAFARRYGTPPATWRRRTQASATDRSG